MRARKVKPAGELRRAPESTPASDSKGRRVGSVVALAPGLRPMRRTEPCGLRRIAKGSPGSRCQEKAPGETPGIEAADPLLYGDNDLVPWSSPGSRGKPGSNGAKCSDLSRDHGPFLRPRGLRTSLFRGPPWGASFGSSGVGHPRLPHVQEREHRPSRTRIFGTSARDPCTDGQIPERVPGLRRPLIRSSAIRVIVRSTSRRDPSSRGDRE